MTWRDGGIRNGFETTVDIVTLLLGTVLVTGFVATATAGFMRGTTAADTITIRIEWEAADTHDPASHLWLNRLVIDGVLHRFNAEDEVVGWKTEQRWGMGSPNSLHAVPANGNSVLNFVGGGFIGRLDVSRSTGSLYVLRNGTTSQVVDLAAVEGQLDISDPTSSAWLAPGVALGLLLCVTLALACRPWKGGRSGLAWLVANLSIIHIAYWAGQAVGLTSDSPGYLNDLSGILAGTPTYFPPGYPLFLGVVKTVAGNQLGGAVTLLQHFMGIAVAVWSYRIVRETGSPRAALLVGLLTGALPTMLASAQMIMSEAPTMFCFVGALHLAVQAKGRHGHLRAMVAGALTGWAVLLRVVPAIALVPALAVLFLVVRPRKPVSLASWALGGLFVVLVPPLAWFTVHTGNPALSGSSGLHLYNRVIAEQGLLSAEGRATAELTALLAPDRPAKMPFWDVKSHPGLRHLSDAGRTHLISAVAREGIASHPIRYATHVPVLASRLLVTSENWLPLWSEVDPPEPRLERGPVLPFSPAALHWRLALEKAEATAWTTLCSLAILGALVLALFSRSGLSFSLVWIPAAHLLSSAAVEMFVPRFHVPITPYLLMLAGVGLTAVPAGLGRQVRVAIARDARRARASEVQ